jgi:hypothetical protein
MIKIVATELIRRGERMVSTTFFRDGGEMAKVYIEAGLDPNDFVEDEAALGWTLETVESLQYMIGHGLDVKKIFHEGATLLHYALTNSWVYERQEVVNLLVSRGVETKFEGRLELGRWAMANIKDDDPYRLREIVGGLVDLDDGSLVLGALENKKHQLFTLVRPYQVVSQLDRVWRYIEEECSTDWNRCKAIFDQISQHHNFVVGIGSSRLVYDRVEDRPVPTKIDVRIPDHQKESVLDPASL